MKITLGLVGKIAAAVVATAVAQAVAYVAVRKVKGSDQTARVASSVAAGTVAQLAIHAALPWAPETLAMKNVGLLIAGVAYFTYKPKQNIVAEPEPANGGSQEQE